MAGWAMPTLLILLELYENHINIMLGLSLWNRKRKKRNKLH